MRFYGGLITFMDGEISDEGLDKVLDLMDEYIELLESLDDKDESSRFTNCYQS